jgi:hypothetical protein
MLSFGVLAMAAEETRLAATLMGAIYESICPTAACAFPIYGWRSRERHSAVFAA